MNILVNGTVYKIIKVEYTKHFDDYYVYIAERKAVRLSDLAENIQEDIKRNYL